MFVEPRHHPGGYRYLLFNGFLSLRKLFGRTGHSFPRSRSEGACALIGWSWRRKGVGCTFCHGMSERVKVSHPARASAIRDRAFGKYGSLRTKRHSLFRLCRAVTSFLRRFVFPRLVTSDRCMCPPKVRKLSCCVMSCARSSLLWLIRLRR